MDDIHAAARTVRIEVSRITGFQPLDAQFGVLSKATLPAQLEYPVFQSMAHVFAILDASLIPQLPTLLAGTDIPHVCLIGDGSDLTSDVAPWLVQVSLNDRLLRSLFTDDVPEHPATWAFWQARPGILIRSDLTLAALRIHLRRFLKVKDSRGKDFFFRFWEPSMVPLYFGNLDARPDLIARWFRPREGGRIEAVLAPDPGGDTPGLWSIIPHGLTDAPHIPHGAFTLNDTDIAVMSHAQTRRQLDALTDLLIKTFPEQLHSMPRADVQRMTDATVSRMTGYGLTQTDTLFRLLAWEVFHGPAFEARDPGGRLQTIIASDEDEADKITLIAARMAELHPA
jgi:hypothetical protein